MAVQKYSPEKKKKKTLLKISAQKERQSKNIPPKTEEEKTLFKNSAQKKKRLSKTRDQKQASKKRQWPERRTDQKQCPEKKRGWIDEESHTKQKGDQKERQWHCKQHRTESDQNEWFQRWINAERPSKNWACRNCDFEERVRGETIENVEEWPDEKRDHKLVKQFNDVDSVLHAVQLPGCGLVGVRPASCSCSRWGSFVLSHNWYDNW